MLFAVIGGFFGCASPYAKTNIDISSSLMQNGVIEITRDITDEELNVITLTSTVTNAPKEASTESVFISSKPEVVSVIETVNVATGVTEAKLIAKSAGEVVIRVHTEGKSKDVKITVLEGVRDIRFADDYSPAFYRGTTNEINENKILYNLNSTQPSLKNRGVSFAFVGDNTNNRIGTIDGNRVSINSSYTGSTVTIRATSLTNSEATADITIKVYDDIDLNKIGISLVDGFDDFIKLDTSTGIYLGMVANNNDKNIAKFLVSYPNKSTSYKYMFAFNSANESIASVEDYSNSLASNSSVSNLTIRANGYGTVSIYGKIFIEGHYGEAKTFLLSIKSDLEPTLLKILSADGSEVGEDVEVYAGGYRSYVGAFVYPSVIANEQRVKVYIPSSVIYTDNGDNTFSGFVDVYSSANGLEKLALTPDGSYAVAEISSSDSVYFAINSNAITSGNLGSFDISFEVVGYEHLSRIVRIRPAIAIETISVDSAYAGSENVLYVSGNEYRINTSLTRDEDLTQLAFSLSIAPAKASKGSLGVRVYAADSLFNVLGGEKAPLEVVNFSSEAMVGVLRAVDSGFAIVEFYSNTTVTRVYVTIYEQIDNIAIGISSYENITDIKADSNGVITEFAISQNATAELSLNVTPIDSAEFVSLGIVQMDGVSVAGVSGNDGTTLTYDNGDLELIYNLLNRSIKVTPKASKTTAVSLMVSGAGSLYIINFNVVSFVAIDAGSVALLNAKGQEATFVNTYFSETVGLYEVASKSVTNFNFTFAGVNGYNLAGDYEVNFSLSNNLYGDLTVDGLNCVFTANRWSQSNYGSVGTVTLTASVTQHGVTYESKVLIYVNKAIQTSSVNFTEISSYNYLTASQIANGVDLSTSVATTNSHNKNVNYVVLNNSKAVLINTLAEKLSYGEGKSISLNASTKTLSSTLSGEFTVIAFTDDSITSSFDVKNLTSIDVNSLPLSLVYSIATIYIADGTEENPYMVYTASDFNSMTADNFYRLGANISLEYNSSNRMVESVAGLDGNGYVVTYTSSAYALDGENAYAGLIYNANGSVIKNLTVNAQINLSDLDARTLYVGGLVGNATNVSISNVKVNTVITLSGTATDAYIGGLAGKISYTGSEEGVINSPTVTGSINVDGLTSTLYRGAIVGSITAEASASILAPYYVVEGTTIPAGGFSNTTIEEFNKATIESFNAVFNGDYNASGINLEKYTNTQMVAYLNGENVEVDLHTIVDKTISPVGDKIRYNYNYVSSDSDIASIDANGLVTFKGYGLVTITMQVTAGENTLSKNLEFYVLPVGYLALYSGNSQIVKFDKINTHTINAEFDTTQGFTLKLVDNNGNIVENYQKFVKFEVNGDFVNSIALKMGQDASALINIFANVQFSDETVTAIYKNGINAVTVYANADRSAFDATATISKSSFNINENITLDVTLYTYDPADEIRVEIVKGNSDSSSKFILERLSYNKDVASSSEITASYNLSIKNYLSLTKAERQAVYGNYEIRILGKAISGQLDKVLKVINITVNPALLTGIDLLNYASESIKAEVDNPNANQYDINEEPTEYIYLGYSSLIKVHLTAENADISEISVTSSSEYAIVGQYYLSSNASNLTKEDRVTPITGGFKTTNIYSEPGEKYTGWIYVRVSLSANFRGASNIVITVKAVQGNGISLTKSTSLTPIDKISLSVTGSTYVADRTEFTLTFKAEKTLDYNELYSIANSGRIDASAGTLNLISFDESKQSATYSILGATLGSNVNISFTYSRTFMGIETKATASHTVQIVKYVIDGVKFVANYGLVDKYGDSIEYEINNYSVVAYNQFIPGIRLTGTWSRTYEAEIIAFENALNNFAISSYNKDEGRISSIFKGKSGSVLELGRKSDEYTVYKDLTNRSVRTGGSGFTTIQMMAIVPEVTTSNAAINAQVRYYYENGEFFLVITGSVGAYHVFGLKDGTYKTFDTNYSYANSVLNKTLTFAIEANSSTDSPIPVNSLSELISLNTEGNNLILTSDIYVTSLTPINAVFDSLDGNNHNIYIYPNAFDGYVGSLVDGKYDANSNIENEDKTLGVNKEASIGLFSTIGENSIVKNLNIKLFEKGSASYINDNGELVEFTEGGLKIFNKAGVLHEGEGIKAENDLVISFGLLAGTNYGTITNSSVSYVGDDDNSKIDYSGALLDSANGYYNLENGIKFSYYFRSLDANRPKGGNIGSLVGSNEGYLTNSRSSVSLIVANIDKYSTNSMGESGNTISTVSGIYGSYNVGGLVGVNSRTISSSYYKNANILSFSNLSSLIGGFVGVNDIATSGDNAMINLSYVEGGFLTDRTGDDEWMYGQSPDEFFRADANFIITSGTVGGFVAVNNSLISNSYSNIDLSKVSGSGNSSPSYAGFVHTNSASGRIEFSYTTSNILLNNETVAPFVGRTSMGENNSGEIYNSYTLEFGRHGGYTKVQAYTTELSASDFSIETSFKGYSFQVEGGASRSEAASWSMPSMVNPGEDGSKTVYIHVGDTSDYIYDGTEDVTEAEKLYEITFFAREDERNNPRANAYYSYREYELQDSSKVYYYVGEGNGTHRVSKAIKTLVNAGEAYYSAVVIGKPSLVEANTIAKSQRVETSRVQLGEGEQTKTTYYFSYVENSDIGLEPLGNKTNPIVISSIDEFSTKLVDGAINYGKKGNDYYYRLIRDIAFDDSTVSPATSNITFYGVLSGNGMKISNARINQVVSSESDVNNAMGLFGKIVGTNEIQASTGSPAIRGAGVSDLTIEISEMYANTYVYAGALTGVAHDAQIYNVSIEQTSSYSTIIYGRNVVGGVVGYALGDTQISNITSEVSAMSTYGRAERAGAFEQYSTIREFRSTSDRYIENKFEFESGKIVSHMGEYNWLNNDDQGDSTVSYVGGLIGVADIYYEIQYKDEEFVRKDSNFFIWSSSYRLPSTSYGILKGAYVGGLVGYNSSSTTISDCEYEIKGYRVTQVDQEQRIEARDVAGGLVSENRGTIYNSRVVNLKAIDDAMASSGIEDNTSYFGNYGALSSVGSSNEDVRIDTGVFDYSTAKIVGGMVGINEGGLIANSYVTASVKATKARVTGGVVGVNVAGSLKNIYITGTVIGKSNENSIEKWIGGVIGVNTIFEESLGLSALVGLQNIYAFNAWEEQATAVYEKSLNTDNKINFGAIMGENTNANVYLFEEGSNTLNTATYIKNVNTPIIFYLDVMNYQNFKDNSSKFKTINPMGTDTTGATGATLTTRNTFKLSEVSVYTDEDGNLTDASGNPVNSPVLKVKEWVGADKNADGSVKNSAINANLNEFFINDDEIDTTFSDYQNAIYANLLNDAENCWSLDELRVLPLVRITNQPLGSEERPYQIISQHTFETYVGFSAARSERTYFEVARDFEIDTTYAGNLDLSNAVFDGCDYTITIHNSLFNEIDEFSVIKNLNIRVAGSDENGNQWIITPTPDYNNVNEYYWGALCNRLYGEANNINLVDDSVINIDLSIVNNPSSASVVSASGYSGKVAYAASSRSVKSFIGGLIGRLETTGFATNLYSKKLASDEHSVGTIMNVSTAMAKSLVSSHYAKVGGLIGEINGACEFKSSTSHNLTLSFTENDVTGGTANLSLALGGNLGNDNSSVQVNTNAYNATVNATLNGGTYGNDLFIGGTYGYLAGKYSSNTANDVNVVFNKYNTGSNVYAGGLAGKAISISSVYEGDDSATTDINMLGNVSVENNGTKTLRANIGGVFGQFSGTGLLFQNIDDTTYNANTEAVLTATGNIHSYMGGLIGYGALSADNVHLQSVILNANGTQANYVGGFAGEWQLNNKPTNANVNEWVKNSSVVVAFNQSATTLKNAIGGVCGTMWTGDTAFNPVAVINNVTTSFTNGITTKVDVSTDTNADFIGGLIGSASGKTNELTITGNNVNNHFTVTSSAPTANIGYGIGKIARLKSGLIDIGTTGKTLMVNYNHAGTLNVGGTVGFVTQGTNTNGDIEGSKFAISKSTSINLQVSAYANGHSTATSATNTLNIGGVVGYASGPESIYMGYNSLYEAQDSAITFNNNLYLNVQSGKSTLSLGGLVGKTEQNININKVTSNGGVDLKNVTYSSSAGYTRGSNALFNSANNSFVGGLIGHINSTNSPAVVIKNNTINSRTINTTATYVGGAIGNSSGSLVMGETASSTTSFTNKGAITSTGTTVGGVIGGAYHSISVMKNVVNNANVSSSSSTSNVGGIIGDLSANYLTIDNASNTGVVTSGNRAGGIIGYAQSIVTVNNSKNGANVTGTERAGGIICGAVKNVTLNNCSNSGKITATNIYAAGIIGYATTASIFTSCSNSGEVSGNNYAGGIVAYTEGNTEITSCSNAANVTAKLNAGGIVAYSNAGATLSGCANGGRISATSTTANSTLYIGGLIAHANAATTITSCDNTGSIRRETTNTQVVYAGGFVGCAIDTVTISGNSTSSGNVQNNSNNQESSSGVIIGYLSGNGSTIQQTNVLGSINGYYNVGGVIGKITANDCELFNYVTVDTRTSGGISSTKGQAGGLIGTYAASGTIYIGRVDIYGSVSGYYAGGIVGSVDDGYITFYNSSVSTNNASVSTKDDGYYAGGAIGQLIGDAYVSFLTTAGIVNNGSVVGKLAAGGFIGYVNTTYSSAQNLNAAVVNNGTVGSTTGTAVAGGIIGINAKGNYLINARNTGDVTSSTQAGGIIGLVNAGTITIETAINTGKITQSATSGSNGTTPFSAGGIVGAIMSGTVNIYNCLNGMSAGGVVTGGEITTTMFNTSREYYTAATTAIIHLGGIVGYVGSASVTINNHRSYTSSGDTTKSDGLTCMTKNFGRINNYSTSSSISTGGIVGYINDPSAGSIKAQNHGRVFSLQGYAGGFVGRLAAKKNFNASSRFSIWSDSSINEGDVISHSSQALLLDNSVAGSKFTYLNNEGTARYYYGGQAGGLIGSASGYIKIDGVSNGSATKDETWIYSLGTTGGLISVAHTDSDILLTATISNTAKVQTGWSNPGGFIGNVGGVVTFSSSGTFTNHGTVYSGYMAGGFISNIISGSQVTLNNCTNTGEVTSNRYNNEISDAAAGIVAFVGGTVTLNNCSNSGTINGGNAGGLVGLNITDTGHTLAGVGTVTITNSANSGSINSTYAAASGGIMGYVGGNTTGLVTIENCSNTGAVTSPEKAGGAVGWINGKVVIKGFSHEGENAYVRASGTYARYNSSSDVYYYCGASGGVVGYVESGSLSIDKLVDGNNEYWVSISAPVQSNGWAQHGLSGAGGIIGSYNSGILALGEMIVDATIGGISNVQSAGGLIGRTSASLTIDSSTSFEFYGTIEKASKAGGLIGRSAGVTIDASNMYLAGFVQGTNFAGGVLGMLTNGTANISNAYNNSEVTATNTSVTMSKISESQSTAGGIIGGVSSDATSARNAVLTNCENYADITAAISAGGAVGLTYYPVVIDGFYNSGDIKATSGSITQDGTTYTKCGSAGGAIGISEGAITIKTSICIEWGDILSAGANDLNIYSAAGGIVGSVLSDVTFDNVTVASDIYIRATIGGESAISVVNNAGGLFGWVNSIGCYYTIRYASVEALVQNASVSSGGLVGGCYGDSSFLFEGEGINNYGCAVSAVGTGSAGGYIGNYGAGHSANTYFDIVDAENNAVVATSYNNSATLDDVSATGGFVGWLHVGPLCDVNILRSVNNAGITTIAKGGNAGGIIGVLHASDGEVNVSISGCENHGVIDSYNSTVGGVIGWVLNAGTIEIDFVTITSGVYLRGYCAGGVIGVYDPAANAQLRISNVGFEEGAVIQSESYCAGGVIGNIEDATVINAVANSPTLDVNGDIVDAGAMVSISDSGPFYFYISARYAGGVIGMSDTYVLLDNVEVVADIAYESGSNYSSSLGGFIGVQKGTTIFRDCVLSNGSFSSTSTTIYNMGGFIGEAQGDVNINESNSNSVLTLESENANSRVGGYIGFASNSANIQLMGSETSPLVNKISLSGAYAGGFVGYASCETLTFSDCENTGDISSTGSEGSVGGIVGYNSSANLLIYADNSGAISCSSNQYAGGFVGASVFESTSQGILTITGVNSGVVSGSGYLGGIIGRQVYTNVTLSNVINTANITSSTSGRETGGFMARSIFGTVNIEKGRNYGAITGFSETGGLVGEAQGTNFVIKDSSNTGAISSPTGVNNFAGGFVGYLLNGDIQISQSSNTGSILTNNTAGGFIGYHSNSSTLYTATFNSCTNNANITGSYSAGFIGISNANLFVNAGTIGEDGSSNKIIGSIYAGGVVGSCTQSSASVSLTDVNNYQEVKANLRAGGLSGSMTSGSVLVSSCSNYGTLSLDSTDTSSTTRHIGGLFGYISVGSASTISNCENTADIAVPTTTATIYAGGIVGHLASNGGELTLTNCEFNGTISDRTIDGELVPFYMVEVSSEYSETLNQSIKIGKVFTPVIVTNDTFIFLDPDDSFGYYGPYYEVSAWYTNKYKTGTAEQSGYAIKKGGEYTICGYTYRVGYKTNTLVYDQYDVLLPSASLNPTPSISYASPYIGNGVTSVSWAGSALTSEVIYGYWVCDTGLKRFQTQIARPSYSYTISGCTNNGTIIAKRLGVVSNSSYSA